MAEAGQLPLRAENVHCEKEAGVLELSTEALTWTPSTPVCEPVRIPVGEVGSTTLSKRSTGRAMLKLSVFGRSAVVFDFTPASRDAEEPWTLREMVRDALHNMRTPDVVLELPSGERLPLRSTLQLGREHAVGDERAFVSRVQLELWAHEPTVLHGKVVGLNPSAIIGVSGGVRAHADKGSPHFELRPGEAVGLLAARQQVRFIGTPEAASTPSDGAEGSAAPSPKRSKTSAAPAHPTGASGAPYASRPLLARAYAPPAKPLAPEGRDALARLAHDPALALASGKAYHLEEGRVLVAYDLYAKARVHLLLLPLGPELRAVRAPCDLRPEHLPQLRELAGCALWLERSMRACGALPPLKVAAGFHRLPSMSHLHLHFVTVDFDAEALKTKRHWNSFNSPFFLTIGDCIRALEDTADARRGSSQLDDPEALLKEDMVCSSCQAHSGVVARLPNMRAVKEHVRSEGHRVACAADVQSE